jgi:hypothetical protein
MHVNTQNKHTSTHTYTHANTHVCIKTCTHTHTRTGADAWPCPGFWWLQLWAICNRAVATLAWHLAHVKPGVCVYVCTCTCAYMYVFNYVSTQVCVCVCKNTCVHVYACVFCHSDVHPCETSLANWLPVNKSADSWKFHSVTRSAN